MRNPLDRMRFCWETVRDLVRVSVLEAREGREEPREEIASSSSSNHVQDFIDMAKD